MGKLETGANETAVTLAGKQATGLTLSMDISHELGTSLDDRTVERTAIVSPSVWPTKVIVTSSVVGGGARALKSPGYLATIRRRESGRIAGLIGALGTHANDEDLVVWTHEPLEKLRNLIHRLSEAEEFSELEHEGNSCEILRQLRDTFLDRGWERYRDAKVRALAVKILQKLASADEVSGDDASQTIDLLLDLGLNPAVGTLLQYAEEEVSD